MNDHGFGHIIVRVSGRAIQQGARLAICDLVTETGPAWAVQIKELLGDNEWHHAVYMDGVSSRADLQTALQAAIAMLGAYEK